MHIHTGGRACLLTCVCGLFYAYLLTCLFHAFLPTPAYIPTYRLIFCKNNVLFLNLLWASMVGNIYRRTCLFQAYLLICLPTYARLHTFIPYNFSQNERVICKSTLGFYGSNIFRSMCIFHAYLPMYVPTLCHSAYLPTPAYLIFFCQL